ncbi:MAG: ABC transporter permease [Clostridia bacterium]|nr:ABC transporter permease [Clostridia bacterium]
MNKVIRYLALNIKRAVKFLPAMLLFTLISGGCAILLLSAMLSSDSIEKQNLKIGVVGDIGETFLNVGVETVQKFDSSRYYVSFLDFSTEEKAIDELKKGNLEGYVVIPEGFTDSLSTDEVKHISYVSANTPDSITPMLTKELVNIISEFVLESRKGISAVQYAADIYGVETDSYDLHMTYINSVLSRDSASQTKETGIGNGLGFSTYCLISFLIILMLLWGIVSGAFAIKEDMALPRVMKARGINEASQIFGEYISFVMITVINLAIVLLALSFSSFALSHEAIETPMVAFITAIKLLPCVCLIASMQIFIYELCRNRVSAFLAQLLCSLTLCYICGCFYPLNSLPSIFRTLAPFLPCGLAFDYAAEVFLDEVNIFSLAALTVYSLAFLIVCIGCRKHRMGRDKI